MITLTRRRFLPLLAVALSTSLLHAQTPPAAPPPPARFTVTPDRSDAIYRVGETVTFEIQAKANSEVAPDAEITWTTSKDSVGPTQTGKVKLANGSAKVTGKLDEAGFLQCRVSVPGDKAAPALGGAAIDPVKIAPSLPLPADFDEFWKAQKQKLAAIPPKATLTPVTLPAKNKNVAFDVQIDALGAPVSGYFARPADAKPKSLPVILLVHGAGVRSANLNGALSWADRGLLAMDINAHGIPNGQPDAF